MGKVIKKCLACGALNSSTAQACKKCESPLLAELDQEEEILTIDPLEAALADTCSNVEQDDELVAQILQEQAAEAKKIVAKEMEKEERKRKKKTKNSKFKLSDGTYQPKYDDKEDKLKKVRKSSGSLRLQAMQQTRATKAKKRAEEKLKNGETLYRSSSSNMSGSSGKGNSSNRKKSSNKNSSSNKGKF